MWYTVNGSGPGVARLGVHTGEPPASTEFTPGKPVIVFLHAALATGDMFLGQLSDPRMTSRYDCVTIDARFHGRTEETETWHDNEEWVKNSSTELMQVSYPNFLSDSGPGLS